MDEALYFRILPYEWFITALLEIVLLFFIFRRKEIFRSHPAFAGYVGTALFQCLFGPWAAAHWGAKSRPYWAVSWGIQAVVLLARWLAVVEIARSVLAAYSGIWKLARGILFVVGMAILVISLALSKQEWERAVGNADRAVELCLAVFIAGMFVFARYYRLPMTNLDRQLAIGFCLFSCAWVVTNTLYETLHWGLIDWDFSQTLAFFASLLLWINAVRKPLEVRETVGSGGISSGQYSALSQQVNTRLLVLNERLNHLLRSQGTNL